MKILPPTDATHEIVLIPRYYPSGALTFTLFDESSQEFTAEITNTYAINNGFLTITFDYDFTNGYKYQILIKESEEVVYRGKLFITDAEPNEYKQTTGLYYYE